MLNNLRLERFKSWRDTGPIRLAPVTGFFGTNSSGKTSLLQSLLLMRQTAESSDRSRVFEVGGSNSLTDLGTYGDILFRHDESAPLSIGVGWESEDAVQVRDPILRARNVRSTLISSTMMALTAEVAIQGNSAQMERMVYSLGDARFAVEAREDGKGYDLLSDDFQFVRAQGRAWPLPAPTRFYGFPDQVRLYYQNAGFLTELELAFEQMCSRIRYLGPLREDPRRQYIHSGGDPADLGRRGELAVDALVASRISNRRVSRGWRAGARRRRLPSISVERLVAEWLQELGLIHSFELESLDDRETLYRVMIRRSEHSLPVLLTDVGFGVSQVLPVLVLLAHASPGETVILEQPEIHLHPAVQSGLADIIIETAIARGVQVIIESHSEHLLNRLQRRLAERNLNRGLVLEVQDVALYFCDQVEGESLIAALELDEVGNILNYPKDFFGNPMEDAVAMIDAAAVRFGLSE